jgi:hypothetical protein
MESPAGRPVDSGEMHTDTRIVAIDARPPRWDSGVMIRFLLVGLCVAPLVACSTAASPSETGDETGDGGGEAEVDYAQGIAIAEFSANQAVRIPLWDGAEVDGSQRNARLLHDRMTMFRATYTIGADWEAREILGRLHLLYEDGTEQTGDSVVMVDGESSLEQVDSTFTFIIPRELADPSTQYYVELIEVDPSFVVDDPEPSRVPESGSLEIGFEALDSQINVVLVPVNDTSCGNTVTIDDDFVADFVGNLRARYPVQDANVEVAEAVDVSGGNPISAIEQLYMAGGSPHDVQYYGVIDSCSSGGTQCLASLNNTGYGEVSTMASFNASAAFCLGLNHGLMHIDCPGTTNSGQFDPAYPYADGKAGVFGWNAYTSELFRPTVAYAMLAGCGTNWISDYEWSKLITRITGA